MRAFDYTVQPSRVLFGAGRRYSIGDELERLGAQRAVVICSPSQLEVAEQLAVVLGGRCAGVVSEAKMHTPVAVTESVFKTITSWQADALIAVGGGSAIGLSKALALRTSLPQIALPTTYAGSEVTSVLGETMAGEKRTLRDARVLPSVVIYDVELTLGLPVATSMASGMNALAHAVEALYSRDANPLTSKIACEAIIQLHDALPSILHNPGSVEARAKAQYGGWLAGVCLGAVGMSLHHKICHVLGGSFGLPHAQTHAVILPYAIAYNEAAAPEAMAHLRQALGGAGAASAVYNLNHRINLPISLKQLGLHEPDIEKAAEIILKESYWSPRPAALEPIKTLLYTAYQGRAPFTPE